MDISVIKLWVKSIIKVIWCNFPGTTSLPRLCCLIKYLVTNDLGQSGYTSCFSGCQLRTLSIVVQFRWDVFLAFENEIPRLSEETRNKLKCRAKHNLRFGAVQSFIRAKKKEKKNQQNLTNGKQKELTCVCRNLFCLCEIGLQLAICCESRVLHVRPCSSLTRKYARDIQSRYIEVSKYSLLRWLPTVLTVSTSEKGWRTKNEVFVSTLGLSSWYSPWRLGTHLGFHFRSYEYIADCCHGNKQSQR